MTAARCRSRGIIASDHIGKLGGCLRYFTNKPGLFFAGLSVRSPTGIHAAEDCLETPRFSGYRQRQALPTREQRPLSGGKSSGIVAITPPHQYRRAVWDQLVAQGRLKYAGQGMYQLVDS